MIARIQKSMKEKDQGFTLIELLVVMIIIGILAAIAIPVFTSQRKKAVDSAAKSDISLVGKEIATHYVDNTTAPTVVLNGTAPDRTYRINGTDVGRVSDNVASIGNNTMTPTGWCVQLTMTPNTSTAPIWRYSATGGLASGACPATP